MIDNKSMLVAALGFVATTLVIAPFAISNRTPSLSAIADPHAAPGPSPFSFPAVSSVAAPPEGVAESLVTGNSSRTAAGALENPQVALQQPAAPVVSTASSKSARPHRAKVSPTAPTSPSDNVARRAAPPPLVLEPALRADTVPESTRRTEPHELNTVATPRGEIVRIKAGTRIEVTIADRITPSPLAAEGAPFKGTLQKALRIKNRTIAGKGSIVEGRFVAAQDGKGRPVLELGLTRIRTVSGNAISVETALLDRGAHKSHAFLNGMLKVGEVGLAILVPSIASATSAVSHTKSADHEDQVLPKIEAGTKLAFKLSRDAFYTLQP